MLLFSTCKHLQTPTNITNNVPNTHDDIIQPYKYQKVDLITFLCMTWTAPRLHLESTGTPHSPHTRTLQGQGLYRDFIGSPGTLQGLYREFTETGGGV